MCHQWGKHDVPSINCKKKCKKKIVIWHPFEQIYFPADIIKSWCFQLLNLTTLHGKKSFLKLEVKQRLLEYVLQENISVVIFTNNFWMNILCRRHISPSNQFMDKIRFHLPFFFLVEKLFQVEICHIKNIKWDLFPFCIIYCMFHITFKVKYPVSSAKTKFSSIWNRWMWIWSNIFLR